MGTWDTGPFDNDTAADWCGQLHDAPPAERKGLILDALRQVTDTGAEYLDSDLAVEAVAAATIVASWLPGGPAFDPPYPFESLLDDDGVAADDLRATAVRALDRVVGPDSEWRELWADSDLYPQALAPVQAVRAALVTGGR